VALSSINAFLVHKFPSKKQGIGNTTLCDLRYRVFLSVTYVLQFFTQTQVFTLLPAHLCVSGWQQLSHSSLGPVNIKPVLHLVSSVSVEAQWWYLFKYSHCYRNYDLCACCLV